MTNTQALEKARKLAEGDLPAFMIVSQIAAELKRAYADGMRAAWTLPVSNLEEQQIRAEADRLKGK